MVSALNPAVEATFRVHKTNHAGLQIRRGIYKQFSATLVKLSYERHVADHFATCTYLTAEAAFEHLPRELRGPLSDMAAGVQTLRHKADHITQSAYAFRRLVAKRGTRTVRERQGSTLNLFSPGPHSAIAAPTRQRHRTARGGIFPNCCLLPHLDSFEQVNNTINIAALLRIDPRGNPRWAITMSGRERVANNHSSPNLNPRTLISSGTGGIWRTARRSGEGRRGFRFLANSARVNFTEKSLVWGSSTPTCTKGDSRTLMAAKRYSKITLALESASG